MASIRAVVRAEARRRACGRIRADGTSPPLPAGCAGDVWELRWLVAGRTEILRDALDDLRREFATAQDPATGLAAALVHQALMDEAAGT